MTGIRSATLAALAAGLALAAAAQEPKAGAAPGGPRAILERAVAATGGADRLAKLASAEWETKASNLEVDPPQARTAKLSGQLPNRFRVDLTTKDAAGKETVTSRVIVGDRGWTVKDGQATEMDAAALARSRGTFFHKQAVQTLVPLLDPKFRLTPLGEASVGGKPADGVLAARDGLPDLKLHFDRGTGLLVKSEMTDENPATGKDEKVEMVFSKHRAFDGILIPAKTETWRDGKKVREVDLVDFRPNAAIDPKRFARP